MTHPNSNNQPEPPTNQRSWRLLLGRAGLVLGVPLLVGLGAGAWWLWNFIHEQLAPLVEKNLTQTLGRPVQLGQVESFSLNSLRFGKSSIPATASDPDRVLLDGINVTFAPLQLLFNRTLKLDVALDNPDVYLEEEGKGNWIATTLKSEEGAGPIRTELDTIRFSNANVVLVPEARAAGATVTGGEDQTRLSQVALASVTGTAQLLDNNQRINYDLVGRPTTGGDFKLKGETRFKTLATNLQVQGQNVLAPIISSLIELPLQIQSGRVNGNLKVELEPKKDFVALFGNADLNAVTAQANQLPQPFIKSQGAISFKGTQVQLNNVSTSYGKIPVVANGVLDTAGEYNIKGRVPGVTLAAAQETLNVKSPVPVAGEVQADLGVTGPILKPVLSGAVTTRKPARIDRVNFSNIRSRFNFSTANSLISLKDIQATPTVGGKITGAGNIKIEQPPDRSPSNTEDITALLNFDFVARNVPGDTLARVYGAAPPVTIGNVAATAKVSGISTDPLTVVSWQAPQATYPGSGQVLVRPSVASLRNTVLNVAGGTVRAAGQLVNNRSWQASVLADGVQLERLSGNTTLKGPLSGRFNLSGTTASTAESLRANGSAILNIAGGTIAANNIQVAKGAWRSQVQATGIQPRRVLQQVPPQAQGPLTGTFNLSGTTAALAPNTIRGNGQARLSNVAGGTVTASNIQLANGQWQALVNASQVQLNRFSPELRGQFRGQLAVSGDVDAVSPAAIRANGQVGFSEGLALIEAPLTAAVRWDGEKVIIQQATAENLRASGLIFARLEGAGAPEITKLDLNVRANNYNLQDISLQTPNEVALSGRADFLGRITGNLTAPNVNGSLRLLDLVVNNVAFEPLLAGNVQVGSRGVNLDLSGSRDRVAVNLDPSYFPRTFFVRRDQAIASGQAKGRTLLANIENFPLELLNIAPPNAAFGPGPIAGILTGDFEVNPQKLAVVGEAAIARPSVGRLRGDRLTAQFRYGNGIGTLTTGEFIQGQSRYALSGNFAQTPNGPKFQGQVNIKEGKIQNILTALQFYDVEDFSRGLQPPSYGNASDVTTTPVGLPQSPLITQLRRFSEIEALLGQQRQQRRNASPIPPLSELQGTFGGEISFDGSLQNGVNVNFNLEGNKWEWGKYNVNQIIAQGSFENGVLTLLPLRLESEETLLGFTGQIGGKQQSGQLRVANFPIEVLNEFVQLPVTFTGQLDGVATLAGNLENPQAVGEIRLQEGTINQKAVQSASGSFSYANARFNFGSNVVISGPQPITIAGSIPFQLPVAKVTPDSDEISLNVNVQDEGLALLNLFTDQVAWQNGQGQVQLQVRGTTQKPVATGVATVKNATISAAALPDPLTNVTGTAQFNFDRIQVVGIEGNFGQGTVVAKGVIPIFANLEPNDPDIDNPLNVSLNQLDLNLENLYEGGVNGNVIITGAALNPTIGGEVLLSQGQVILPTTQEPVLANADPLAAKPADARADSSDVPVSPKTNSPNPPEFGLKQRSNSSPNPSSTSPLDSPAGAMVEFNNFRLTLDDNISIVSQPLLNFQARGTLNLNGSLSDPIPDGTIRLVGGGINLFTTQFVLARGFENEATFKPEQGLDPNLNVRLVASVPETTRTPVPSSPLSGEIADAPTIAEVGTLQTVRVRASAEGPASRLSENLELTSEPSRTQSEIVALIGGSFVNTLGSGDTAGLANFASSALLGNFQGNITSIGNTLGLSELRIVPTLTNETEARSRSGSALGIAAEAGIDISRSLYFSLLGFLTPSQPTQFGLSYRLNDQIRLRTATDLSGENRAVIEYQNRF